MSSQNEVPFLHAIYMDTRSASATHNIYAYRISTPDGICEYYYDDGEFGAGRRVLKQLQDAGLQNILVCVTRWFGGKELGRARFDHIEEAVRDVLTCPGL